MIHSPPLLLDAAYVHALTPFIVAFLAVSFVVALVTSLIRPGDLRRAAVETWRFFSTIVVCIVGFALVVALLEWLFLRR